MKTGNKITAFLLAVLLVVTILPMQTQAKSKITINKTKTTMYVGQAETLKISGTGRKVTWVSGNRKIATVSTKGKVTPKKAGKVTISVRVSGKTYKCKVTVKKPYINATKKTLQVGDTYSLKLTGTKIKSATSNNKKVATVSSKGKVTAKKSGTATITLKGKDRKSYKCRITVQKKHVHKYIGKVTTQATCVKDGVKSYTCSCGDSYTKVIPKTGHDYKVTVFSTPSCTEHGCTQYWCKNCGYYYETIADAFGHDYAVEVTEPTCQGEGYTTYTCTRCGYDYRDNRTDRVLCDYQEEILRKADCTHTGKAKYTCKYCGHSYESETPEVHEWETKYMAPTCTESGGTYEECRQCHEIVWREVEEVAPHDYEKRVVEPTCREEGYTEYICQKCQTTKKEDYLPSLPHQYVRKVVTEPTCDTAGVRWNVCENCGAMEYGTDEEIPALGHDFKGHADATGRVISCNRCDHELAHIILDIPDKFGSMVAVDGNQIHMIATTMLRLKRDRMSVHYGYEGFVYKVKDGKYVTMGEGNITGYENEQAAVYQPTDLFFSNAAGNTRLEIYYEDILVDTLDIEVTGIPLVQEVKKVLAGGMVSGYLEDEYRSMVLGAAGAIMECITPDMTDSEKVKAIVQWLHENIVYGAEGTREEGQRASEAFHLKKAVCGGYAEAMNFFMDILDIPCCQYTGAFAGQGHAWNVVYVDAGFGDGMQWYYVDATNHALDLSQSVARHNELEGLGKWNGRTGVDVNKIPDRVYYTGAGAERVYDPLFP